jgi:CRISPR-associated protein Cmr2
MAHALPQVPEMQRPTLSVGIAVGHFLENLEDLLAYGRAAEKHAKKEKPDRNGLAVHLHKRGGAPVTIRKQWTANLDKRLTRFAGWFLARVVSNRTPYELHRLAELYDDWPATTLKDAIQRDAFRVIEKKRPGGEKTEEMQEIRAAVNDRVNNAADLRGLAAELLIARQLAVALRQSGGGKKP